MRIVIVVLFALLLFLPAGLDTKAAGTIREDEAEYNVGTAPILGVVTVDPDLQGGTQPVVPSVGTQAAMGSMPGSMSSIPGSGSGADGAFHAMSDQTLAGGTYNFTTYTVDDDVTVTYSGAVLIRTTGKMTVNGKIVSQAALATLTIDCEGDLDIVGPASGMAAGIQTAGANAAINIHVAGAFLSNNRCQVTADASDISLHVHRASATGPGITTAGGLFNADGMLTIRALGDVVVDGTFTSDGGTTVQSREGRISFGSSTSVNAGGDGHCRVEGQTEVRVDGGSYVEASDGDVTVACYAGDVLLLDHATVSSTYGTVTVEASGAVTVTDGTRIDTYDSDIRVAAHGGDVRIGVDDTDLEDDAYISADKDTSALEIEASGMVWIGGDAWIQTFGPTNVRAYGTDLRLTSNGKLSGSSLDVRAANAITADPGHLGSAALWTTGMALDDDMDLSAGGGGISLYLASACVVGDEGTGGSSGGSLNVLTTGPIRLRGRIEANRDIHVSTTHPSLDVFSAVLRTFQQGPGASSGSILIESWATVDAVIDADGLNSSTGSSTVQSGDITICVRGAGGEPIEDAIEAFILPKKVKVKVDADEPEKSKFKASGYFDLGPDDPALTGPATLTVGGLVFDIPGMTASGTTYRYDGNGIAFRIKKRKNGSSRAKFLLKMKRDLGGQIDPNAVLDMELTSGDLTGIASVGLTDGRYRIGKTKGMLFAPALYLQKAKCKLKDGAEDKLKLTLGLSTDGTTPAAASDVRVRMGTAVDVTIPAASFKRDGDRWVFDGDLNGITQVVLDYGKETVTIKGKGMALADYSDGANAEAVAVDVGADTRAVSVRMVRSGKSMKY